MDIPMKCKCGRVRGVVTGITERSGSRLVCYCDDCQAYAHFLGREADVLDAHGGTDIYQTVPARVRITEGAEELRAVRLIPKGMNRFYAACCRTPIGNTLQGAEHPFVGLVHACLDAGALQSAVGAPVAYVQGAFARKGKPAFAHEKVPLGYILRTLRIFVPARFKGLSKPSAFFDARTGEPVAKPEVMTESERARLREEVRAASAVTA